MRSIKDIFRSYAQFDDQGRHTNGTDKQSNHAYGDAYESIITEAFSYPPSIPPHSERPTPRDRIRLMMEVGVADGACLLAWSEVFPNAWVVGMDIHPLPPTMFKQDRIEFHLGDQRKREDCERAAKGRLFDLIIEDATHVLTDTLLTLLWLWPSVRPGGLYVVEEFADIHSVQHNLRALFPGVEIVNTQGPHGGIEPLTVFRKTL